MSINGLQQQYFANSLDGLTYLDVNGLSINGDNVDLTNYLPYTGANKAVDVGVQPIRTSYNPVANNDVVNLVTLQNAITYVDGVSSANFVRYTGSLYDVDLGSKNIKTTHTPSGTTDLTNKDYVDAGIGTKVPYTGAVYDLDLGAQDLTATIITGTQIMLSGTAPTPARVAGYNTTGLYYLVTPATYLTNLTSDPQTQIDGKGGLGSSNSWTGTNSFTNTVTLAPATATPSYTLGVNASNQVIKYANPAGVFSGSVSSGYVPYASSANVFANSTIYISGTNTGIGTTSPLHKFHVEGTIAGQSILSLFPALNGGAGSNINMTAGNGAFGSIEAYDTANTNKLPLCLNPYGGNVGIGLINPTYKLQVAGTGLFGYIAGSKKGIFIANEDSYGTTPCIQGVSSGLGTNSISLNPGGGNIGLGRITADLCRVESQTSTLTACSSFYITPGPATTFYPVVFNTIPAHDTGQNKWKVTVARTSVHQDSYFKGSLLAEFEGNSSVWGNSADSFSYNIAGCPAPATYDYFVGNAYVDFTSGWLVVYLRGATTYQYSMEGASLNYYPSSSPFVSYTIPYGNNTILYATNTPTAPFTNTYLKYDSFTGLSTYTSASYGTVLSPLINRVGGGVKLSLIPTNGDPEYGFASYQSSGNAGGATYCNAISNTPVTDYSPTTWSGKGYTLFTPTTDPGPNKCALGIGSAGNGAYGVYGDNYITSLTPNITWTNLWISAHQTLIRYDGNLAAYSIAGGWVNVSDEREKEEIKDLKTGRSLERILACKPKFYKRKYYEKEGTPVAQSTKDAVHIGLLAQDCLQSNKHCVSTWENTQIDDEDKTRYGVNYNDYTVHLIGAVQEQQKMIETLTERSKVMEEHARDLEAQLSQSRKDLEDYKLLTEERFNKLAKMISGK